MIIDPNELNETLTYKLLVGCVAPRPIAWVSTKSKEGINNLAPFSFYNIASRYPPTLAISISYPTVPNKAMKDSLKNIKDTKELVVNVVDEQLVTQMNITASEVPSEIDEFELANLTFEDSKKVSVPRVKEAKISMECISKQIIPIGIDTLVIAEIVNFYVMDHIIEDGKILMDKLKPIGRMAGPVYCTTENSFTMSIPDPNELLNKNEL